jgi:hypothetical protein
LNVGHFWNRQIFFRGSCGKRNRRLNVLRLQGRKRGENRFRGIAVGQAGENGSQDHPRPLEDRLAASDILIANDSIFVIHEASNYAVTSSPAGGNAISGYTKPGRLIQSETARRETEK